MKKFLLKLVAIFEVGTGLFGIYAVISALLGSAPPELAPILWYGIFPLASAYAGVALWRASKFAFGLSVLVQLLQIPLFMTEKVTLNLGALINLSVSGIWCAGDGCWVRVLLGINFLAVIVLIILLTCKSALQTKTTNHEYKPV